MLPALHTFFSLAPLQCVLGSVGKPGTRVYMEHEVLELSRGIFLSGVMVITSQKWHSTAVPWDWNVPLSITYEKLQQCLKSEFLAHGD